jgi:hypothetical protein
VSPIEPGEASPVLKTSYSHLFPGARLTVEGGVDPAEAEALLIVFGDASAAPATLRAVCPGETMLDVDGYATAAGTAMAPMSWSVVLADAGSQGRVVRVLGKRAEDS